MSLATHPVPVTLGRLQQSTPPIFPTVYSADPVGESVTWFERYGVSAHSVPRTWAEFDAYVDGTLQHRPIKHRTAAYGVSYADKGWPPPARLHPLAWRLVRAIDPLIRRLPRSITMHTIAARAFDREAALRSRRSKQ